MASELSLKNENVLSPVWCGLGIWEVLNWAQKS